MVETLGRFLAARRARITAEDLGLVTTGVRRVPGLRREEVAQMAGVSVDYYTRLEQGRERRPSASVLGALARVLGLDREARGHLFRLAGAALVPEEAAAREQAGPELAELLEQWPSTPAFVINRRYDVLAANRPAAAFYSDFERVDNLGRMIFLDPAATGFFVDWDRAAHTCVGGLRLALGFDPRDAETTALVARLESGSAEFRRRWRLGEVQAKSREAKEFCHSAVGKLTLEHHAFDVRESPGQQLVVYRALPGGESAERLARLGNRPAVT
ncbi:helix-turn-helix transcriptional regulator [Glycomyces halotolerans]